MERLHLVPLQHAGPAGLQRGRDGVEQLDRGPQLLQAGRLEQELPREDVHTADSEEWGGHADTDGYLNYLKPPSPSNCTSVPQRIFTTSPRRMVSTRSSPWRKESRPRRQKSSSL